jgi:hypothetical protein
MSAVLASLASAASPPAACAAIHLRSNRHTGADSLLEWLAALGFDTWRPALPCKRETTSGGYSLAKECDPYSRVGAELGLLASNASFFDAHQAGRRVVLDYGSSWQVSTALCTLALCTPALCTLALCTLGLPTALCTAALCPALVTPALSTAAQVSSPAYLNDVVPLLPKLREVYASRACEVMTITMLRDPADYLVGQYFADEVDETRSYKAAHPTRSAARSRALTLTLTPTLALTLGCTNPGPNPSTHPGLH